MTVLRHRRLAGIARRGKLTSSRTLGVLVLLTLILVGVAAFNRNRITVTLSSGDTIKAEFARAYKLEPYRSVVKVAGVKVGEVTGVDITERHTSVVSMKVDDGILGKLGEQPSAAVRPTLLVGGLYYVELSHGGAGSAFDADHPIPLERTTTPVELDHVLTALTPDAQKAMQNTVGQLDATLQHGGRQELRELLNDAPGSLGPAGVVLDAARGTRPETDLTGLVTGLQQTASALTSKEGQLASIIDSLTTTSAALADERRPLAQAVATGPETLRTTRAGLADLDGTLQRLTTTAQAFRPAARQLDPLLAQLDPVLERTLPVVSDLRILLQDARPLVDRLMPTAQNATGVLTDVRGPVLDRLNGPIKDMVLSPWHGTGMYQGGGNDHLFYQETGYLLSHFDEVWKFHDSNGAAGRLMAGVGMNIPGGSATLMPLEEYLESLGLQQPVGPQEGTRQGAPGLIPPPAAGTKAGGLGPLLPALNLPLVSGSSR
ncbi:MlaD family protein [Protofrankia symbiont of Coriaria ruscifolia]|uniref:Mammalian cell entry domain-containing protein n=1 Tax=Candidatus Protofrankia californiensis TaxID=1839754 RepID=A0A1C3NZ70_9ACTN|nr:MlaD family protein [Protofrankia symbiont of Coriaria ruscifolia]SBW22844.1 mammalian cell entry domain-containing protein [Candidatus Protofrankia californiensis]